jgi:hypothetical protein
MSKAKKLKAKAEKLSEQAKAARVKANEATKKKSADAAKLKEAAKNLEAEAEEAKQAAMEAAEAEETEESEGDDANADGDDTDDDDADKDKAIIQKMLSKYIGDTDDMDKGEKEALEKMAMEAMQNHKEMGASESEAYERAGHAIALAKHMQSKQTEANEAGDDDGGDDADAKGKGKPNKKKPAASADNDDDSGDGDTDEESEACGSKESKKVIKDLKKQLLETSGRLAALEAKASKGDVEVHVDKTLRESGLPKSVTKTFREAAGDIKSIKQFDSSWKLFLAATKIKPSSGIDWTPFSEKTVLQESDDSGSDDNKDGLDFSEAAVDDLD